MSLAIYVHIPYCLQRCRYCDFTTFEFSEILPPEKYVRQLLSEIRLRRDWWPQSDIQTLYFGGGTPSLISPELIVAIKQELANSGFRFLENAEVTLEINPATLDEGKLLTYLRAGFNRFSVGAQTFNDRLLKSCGRRHTADDTRATLKLLRAHGLNYSFDLLFALPGQSLAELEQDLLEVAEFAPPHLSAYCLTVPDGHPMSTGRAPEEEQVDMFGLIGTALAAAGLAQYEISNFARPGFESRHNMIYWNDGSYWGIGLSSHSYDSSRGPFGTRFWNPKGLGPYAAQAARTGALADVLPEDQREQLLLHEAMTDFCHMHLRTMAGLPEDAVRIKFPERAVERLSERCDRLVAKGLLERLGGRWRLTPGGLLISNKVFEELCFLAADGTLTPQAADSYCAV